MSEKRFDDMAKAIESTLDALANFEEVVQEKMVEIEDMARKAGFHYCEHCLTLGYGYKKTLADDTSYVYHCQECEL